MNERFCNHKIEKLFCVFSERLLQGNITVSVLKKRKSCLKKVAQKLSAISEENYDIEFIVELFDYLRVSERRYIKDLLGISVEQKVGNDQKRLRFLKMIWEIDSKRKFNDCIDMILNNDITKYYFDPLTGECFYIDTSISEIRLQCEKDISTFQNNLSKKKSAYALFETALGNIKINDVGDLSIDTLIKQCLYFCDDPNSVYIWSALKSVYLGLAESIVPDLFQKSGINLKVVYRTRFISEMLKGYRVTPYVKWDRTPEYDKWLLVYDNSKEINSSVTTSECKQFDFSNVCHTYKAFFKDYIWNADMGIESKCTRFRQLQVFFDYLNELETGKILSVFCRKKDVGIITPGKIQAFKAKMLSDYGYGNTSSGYLTAVTSVVKYYSTIHPEVCKSDLIFSLKNSTYNSINTARALSEDELNRLVNEVNYCKDNIEDELCSIIVHLLITTELRISNILALRVDCIKEAYKRNQYILVSRNKTAGKNMIEIPIPLETKKLIERAISLSETCRCECTQEIADFIFIVDDNRYLTIRNRKKLISKEKVNGFIKKCCVKAGISDSITTGNLRDTHVTTVIVQREQKNMPELSQKILNGHRTTTVDYNHYLDKTVSLRRVLEATNNIIIGDVDINGNILSDDNKYNETELVEHDCGYCSMESCNMYSMLGCLMCKNFVTTPSRLPYFERYIELLDKKILESDIPHDKEDAVNIKRLISAYIEKIYIVQSERRCN